jgi:hypothetical protein
MPTYNVIIDGSNPGSSEGILETILAIAKVAQVPL